MQSRSLKDPIAGDTPLHTAIRNHCSTAELNKLIEIAGAEQSSLWARTVNDAGELPIELCHPEHLCHPLDATNSEDTHEPELIARFLASLNSEGRKEIYSLLLPLTTTNPLTRKLNDTLSFNDLCLQFSLEPGSQLYKNIKAGCDAVNLTRQIMRESSSHPDANKLSKKSANELVKKVNRLILDEIENLHETLATESNGAAELTDIKTQQMKFNLYQKFACGNCREFAEVAAYHLSFTLGIPCQLLEIQHGNHNLIIIGHEYGSHTFSKDAVLCDAWAGVVLPASIRSLRQQYLSAWKEIWDLENEQMLNVLPAYNPNFHILTVLYEFPAQPSKHSSSSAVYTASSAASLTASPHLFSSAPPPSSTKTISSQLEPMLICSYPSCASANDSTQHHPFMP